MSFSFSLTQPIEQTNDGLAFLFDHDSMLVCESDGSVSVPSLSTIQKNLPAIPTFFTFGNMNDIACYTGDLNVNSDSKTIGSLSFTPLRKLFYVLPEAQFRAAITAIHSVRWYTTTQFCGKCGNTMQLSVSEPAKVCITCGYHQYPRISPAVIVAVIKENKILLGHSGRFPQKLYSVLAGFVEPGETLEACVVREIKEETGVDVDTVKYFGSQPWPFPDSLMIGFTARYAGGTIKVDGKEVLDANWFSADSLPNIPNGISISRELIDWFTNTYKGSKKNEQSN